MTICGKGWLLVLVSITLTIFPVQAQKKTSFQPPEYLPLPVPEKVMVPSPAKNYVPSSFESIEALASQKVVANHITTFCNREGTMPESCLLSYVIQELDLPTIKEAHEPVGKQNNPLNFSTYGLGQGLSSLNIHNGVSDRHGNLWLSTGFGGVFRFDGQSFANYSEQQGLSNNLVLGLLIDHQERIWCGTLNGLNVLDGKQIITFFAKDGLPGNTIFEMVEDPHGYIWVSSYEGLARIDPNTFEITKFNIHPEADYDHIFRIDLLPDSTIWIGGVQTPAFIKISGTREQPQYELYHLQLPFKVETQGDLVFDSAGRIWMAHGNDLLQIGKEAGLHFEINRYTKKQGLTGAKIDCLALDNLDRLWIGSREGLLLMIPDRAGAYNQYRKITDADGLPNNYIISLFTDSYHNIWIGCNDAGLTRYQSNGFQSLTTREGLPSNRVSSILEDRKGRIWIATFNNGIARYQRAMGKQPAFFQYFSERNGLSSNKIYKLFEDPHGDIWIGARSGSLMRYAGTMGGQEVFYHYNEGLPGDFVTDIMLDHDDHLWFATQSLELESGSGVCRFGEDQMMFIGVDQGLISEDIWCFSQDSKGTFWFGSWGDGITAYHLPDAHDGRSSIKYFTAYNALGGNKIRSLLSDRYGHTWAGGVGAHGLTRFSANDSSYQVFTTDDGLCDNSVMSMLEDHEGSMWFGGYEGLSLFKDNQFSTFKMEDGFQGVGCLTNAICQTRDERIWVGTYDRLTVFDPHDIITPNRTPYTQITDIKLFNEHIDWKKPQQRLSDGSIVSNFRCDGITPWYQIPTNLSLKHSDNFIQFDYVGISYQGYSKVRYQHRLKGLEQDWNQPSDRSNVSYANLSPGKYIFEVRSKSGNSDWSLPTQYSFRIRPPWWLTWWAYVSYVILFTSMIYVFIRLRVQSAIKKYRAIESLRLKISSDLHDDVGTTLAGLAMQSELIAKQGRNGLTEDLRELSQLSRSAMDQMRDIVWAMDSRRDHYQNLVDRIREFALKQVNKSDFEFHMDTTNIPMDDFLPPDIRQHVYFIIKEAITNSLKHSDGHCIDLTIRQERNNLLVHIQDDGTVKRPINREGLGLSNMRMRAGKMNAELWVSQEHGFEVTCNIPLAKIRR